MLHAYLVASTEQATVLIAFHGPYLIPKRLLLPKGATVRFWSEARLEIQLKRSSVGISI